MRITRLRLSVSLVLSGFALLPQPGRALECDALAPERAHKLAATVFEGFLRTSEDLEPAQTECNLRSLEFDVGDVWKLPGDASGTDTSSASPHEGTLVGGPNCFGCGARVGARYIAYADSRGRLLRLRYVSPVNGLAWREREVLGEPIRPRTDEWGKAPPPAGADRSTAAFGDCVAVDPQAALARAEIVFIGFVTRRRALQESGAECRPSSLLVKVDQTWKGEPQKELEVFASDHCMGCSFSGRMLVYAERDSVGQLRILRARSMHDRLHDAEFLALGKAEHPNVQEPIMETPLGPLVLAWRILLYGWGDQEGLLGK